MKKSIKEKAKANSSSLKNKNKRSFTAEGSGYKEDVYNTEEQANYKKSDLAKNNKKNTAGPKS